MNPIRFVFLDYLRIFAATSVFFGHIMSGILTKYIDSNQFRHEHVFYWEFLSLIQYVSQMGGSGVIVFFLISGYIITHTLQSTTANNFLIRRLFRIYPAFIVASILEYVISSQNFEISTILGRITLLGDFLDTPYGLGGVEWTLRVELYFYIFMYASKQFGFILNRQFPIIFLAPALCLLFYDPYPSSGFATAYINLYVPLLFMGSCVYIAQYRNDCRVLSIIVMFILYIVHIQGLIRFGKGSAYFHFLNTGIFIWFFLWYLQKLLPGGYIITAFSNLTYSIYLFHDWTIDPLFRVLNREVNVTIFVLFLILISVLTYYIVELPGITLGRMLTRRSIYKQSLKSL